MQRLLEGFTRTFFVWTVLAGILAVLHPPFFTWFQGAWIPVGLGIIMLGMGITLTTDDFRRVLRRPGAALAGIFLQYAVMPLLGWLAGHIFGLRPAEAVGLILVACCPGGTASNVIAFVARADVPLSVSMTAVSTMLSVALTPLLTGVLVGDRMEVDVLGLLTTTLTVVIVPVVLGIALNRYLPAASRRLQPYAPPVAVLVIILIVGSILARNGPRLLPGEGGLRLVAAVVFLHGLGFLIGYLLAYASTRDPAAARTISIEVGMQNSGLGVTLARRHFADPVVALPAALSALCHCIVGSALAALWRRSARLPLVGEPTR